MPEAVRVDWLGDACLAGDCPEHLLDGAGVELLIHAARAPPQADEDSVGVAVLRPAALRVPLEASPQNRFDRDQPLPAPLAGDLEVAVPPVLVKAGDGQPKQLAEPDAGVAEDPDDELVALTVGRHLEVGNLVRSRVSSTLRGTWTSCTRSLAEVRPAS